MPDSGVSGPPRPDGVVTSLQRSMVLASLRAPRAGVYLVQDVCELKGTIDLARLRKAWDAVLLRHPVIGFGVSIRDGEPVGFHLDDGAGEYWREEDCTDPGDLMRRDRERGFDFEAGAPMRIAVIRTSANSITVIWTVHHALLDGRSLTLVWQEWLAIYEALVHGRDLPTAEAPAAPARDPIADTGAESFWRDYLRGLSNTTDYIVERIQQGGDLEDEPVARERVELSDDLTRRLRELAESHGVSLNNVVQGAWALLLSRYSGRSDVVFGVTRSGRTSSPEDACKVGFYINTLPLRIEVNPQATLGPWLQEVRRRSMALRDVEQTPLHQVAKWSDLPPGMPPFDSLLNYDHQQPGETLLKMGAAPSPRAAHRLGVDFGCLGQAGFDARGDLRTRTALAADDGRRCRAPERVTRELRVAAGRAARRPEHAAGGRTEAPAARPHQHAAARPVHTPDLRTVGGTGSIQHGHRERQRQPSYGGLNERANHLAWRLREAGAGVGDLVAIRMESSPESVIAVLAVLKAGAAFLPIDPNLPEQRLEAVSSDARPKVILGDCMAGRTLAASARELSEQR